MQQQREGLTQPGLLTDLDLLHATSLSIPALSAASRTSSRYAPDSDADDHASPEYVDGKLPRPAKKAQRVRDPSPRLPGSPDRTDPGAAERMPAGGSRLLADDDALMSAASLDTDAEGREAPKKKKKKHRKQGEGNGGQALDIEMGHTM